MTDRMIKDWQNYKGCGRIWSLPSWSTIPAFVWRDWRRKPWEPSIWIAYIPAESQTKCLINMCLEHCCYTIPFGQIGFHVFLLLYETIAHVLCTHKLTVYISYSSGMYMYELYCLFTCTSNQIFRQMFHLSSSWRCMWKYWCLCVNRCLVGEFDD